jgi:integrase
MNPEWASLSFEEFLKKEIDAYVFRVDDKDMTTAFGKMFSRFLEGAELLIDKSTGKHRTLYSLRHLYAVFALTYNRMSVYTLAKHMGTSVAMIEQHYGQVLLRDNAAQIAGHHRELVTEQRSTRSNKPTVQKKEVIKPE